MGGGMRGEARQFLDVRWGGCVPGAAAVLLRRRSVEIGAMRKREREGERASLMGHLMWWE